MTAEAFRLAPQEYNPAIPVKDIREHPENYNQGDVGAISESMDEHGFFGAIGVQKSTGHILWGNHRYRTAVMQGAATLPGFWLDVDDDEAERILAVDNRTAALAAPDEQRLVDLLTRRAQTARGLAGTGYDGDDLDGMIAMLNGGQMPPGAPTGAGWAETDEEHEKRAAAVNSYGDRKQGGSLVEMILVYPLAERDEVGRLLDAIRRLAGDDQLRGAEVMLRALRIYHRVLSAGEGDAGMAELSAAATVPAGG